MSEQIPRRFLDLVAELDFGFWQNWYEKTADFADTEDADYMKFTVMESAISTIIMNYILGFPKDKRSYYLENMILQLRTLELRIRDMDIQDLYE
jgi:hypothetical protein